MFCKRIGPGSRNGHMAFELTALATISFLVAFVTEHGIT
jgi:hypothetical protein